MSFDLNADIHSIVAAAATLEERIERFHRGGAFQAGKLSSVRAERWRTLLNSKDPGTLPRRLNELGLTEADLSRVLGETPPNGIEALPGWADTLRQFAISKFSICRDNEAAVGPAPAEDSISSLCRRLYRPFVEFARTLLQIENGDHPLPTINENAWHGLETHLTERLTQVGRQLVEHQWAVFQTIKHFGFGSTEAASDFLRRSPGQRLLSIFRDYPVHARQCCVLIDDWTATSARLLRRLGKDYCELSQRFNARGDLGEVAGIRLGLSDSHEGGQTVAVITFGSGQKIVYKPRSLAVEAHFSDLLTQIEDPKSFRRFKALQVWDRSEYGWAEFVAPTHCQNQAAIRRFYWRAGALLGCVHLSHGVDCHRDNFIASGEQPVLIDLDGLWHPQDLPQPDAFSANALSRKPIMRTGLLPGGCIAAGMANTYSALERELGEINPSDSGGPHLPVMRGSPVRATRYTRHVMAGFRWAGRALLSEGSRRAAFISWLAMLKILPRRHILRSTVVYGSILRGARGPQCLKSGIDHSIELEVLRADSPSPATVSEEVRALQRMDFPYFRQPDTPVRPAAEVSSRALADYQSQIDCIRDQLAAG